MTRLFKHAAWVMVLLMAGCATVTSSPPLRAYEREEGAFRGRWWSYYDRGVWLSRNGYLDEAEADFRMALRGRSRDAWSARTYGLHFTEYFPNRELGVLLLEQGRLEEADTYLQRSLERVDTARVHFYLDEVTRAKIAAGIIRDDTPPRVDAAADTLTPSRNIALAIAARDDVGVAEVRVEGRRLYQRGSRPEADFLETVDLDEGEHRIRVEAVDLSERVTTEEVVVRVDTTAPTIAVLEPGPETATEAASVTLRVAAVDNFDIEALYLDGQRIGTTAGPKRIDASSTLNLQPGENQFVLRARDAAGNENQSIVRVYRGAREAAATKLWWLQHHAPERLKTASAGGPSALAAVLASAYAATAGPLKIDLTFPDIPDDTVYPRNEIPVIGRVTAATALQQLTVGGGFIPLPEGVEGGYFEFERRVPLERGQNRIEVAAVAAEAPPVSEEFTINADFLLTDRREHKMPLAVLAAYNMDGSENLDLRAEMETRIVASERFNVLTREELVLEAILTEQQISTELGSRDAALALGRVIPAQSFIMASVSAYKDGYTVRAQAISVETGQIIVQPDAFVQDLERGEAVRAGMDDIAEQLKAYFPRVTGRVEGASGREAYLDYTTDDGVREGMYALVLQEGPPLVVRDRELPGDPVLVGRVRLRSVRNDISIGDIVEEATIAEDMYTLTW